jgi:hypothetical protein
MERSQLIGALVGTNLLSILITVVVLTDTNPPKKPVIPPKQEQVKKTEVRPSETIQAKTESDECGQRFPDNPNQFVPTPKCYEKYLNTINWGSGKSVVFSHLEQCRNANIFIDTEAADADLTAYACWKGYVSITDPRGTQVCQLDGGWPTIGVFTKYGGRSRYSTTQCVWKR